MNHSRTEVLLLLMFFCSVIPSTVYSQSPNKLSILYDKPNDINAFYLKIQPLYAEMYVSNINAGLGVEANYYLEKNLDFRLNIRKTYSSKFDFSRSIGERSNSVDNELQGFSYFEGGIDVHMMDVVQKVVGRGVVFDSSRSISHALPKLINVSFKQRRIVAGRLGVFNYRSATNIGRVLEDQDQTLSNGNESLDHENLTIVSMTRVTGYSLGGSITLIKNFAYEHSGRTNVEDLNLNIFLDLLYAPGIKIDAITYLGEIFDADAIERSTIGFRLGAEGMYNHNFSFSYAAEIGYRPGIVNRTFYTLIKIGFPVFVAAGKK